MLKQNPQFVAMRKKTRVFYFLFGYQFLLDFHEESTTPGNKNIFKIFS